MDPFRGLLHIIIYTYIIIYIYIKITAISGRPRGNAQACIFYCPPQELIPLFNVFPYRRLGSGSTSVFYVTPWGFWGYPWGGGSGIPSRHVCPRRVALVVGNAVREPRGPPGLCPWSSHQMNRVTKTKPTC